MSGRVRGAKLRTPASKGEQGEAEAPLLPALEESQPGQKFPKVLYFVVVIDMLAASMIMTSLPAYKKHFSWTASTYTMLASLFGLSQLVGSPFIGRVSDIYGRKAMLIISCLVTSIGYFLLTAARSTGEVAASRFLVGLCKHSISLSYAYVADCTSGGRVVGSREMHLGRIGVASNLGLSIGPIIGGHIASSSKYWIAPLVSSVIFLFNATLLWLFLPAQNVHRKVESASEKKDFWGAFWKILNKPNVLRLLLCRLDQESAFQILQSVFAIFVLERFGTNEAGYGRMLSFFGVVSVLVQGVLVGAVTRNFLPRTVMMSAMAFLGCTYYGFSLASHVPAAFMGLACLAIGNNLLKVSIVGQLTRHVNKDETGAVMGIYSAGDGFTRVTFPFLSGILLDNLGNRKPFQYCSLLLFCGVLLVPRFARKLEE